LNKSKLPMRERTTKREVKKIGEKEMSIERGPRGKNLPSVKTKRKEVKYENFGEVAGKFM